MIGFETNLVCTKKIRVSEDRDRELNLEYYMVSGKTSQACTTYGIQVVLVKDSGQTEKAFIPDILLSRPDIYKLIDLLSSNSVTPVSAYDVVYDCIA